MRPRTHYAKCGDLDIAYQVTGSGTLDLVYVPGWVSNLDYAWELPAYARVFDRLGSFARLIRFDKRGTGLSEREAGFPTLEQRIEDVRAVMDAVGSERAALIGTSEGGNMSVLFAATYPERTQALVLFGCFAKGLWAPDYPWAATRDELDKVLDAVAREWGGPFDLSDGAPSLANDEETRDWFAAYLRNSASPKAAISIWDWNAEIDVRAILPAVHVPTLVLHRSGDRWQSVEEGRYLAEHLP
ncbi:MAG: alpha/beta fold hydrolase, partial [Boseongicola sp.]